MTDSEHYTLGIDVGTTYTGAAVTRRGHTEMLPLGSTSTTMPTVVLLRDDGQVLVGEAAERRAVTEPGRIAREFKRRLGDPTPIVVGGTPYGAESLIAHVIRTVVTEATEREGSAPAVVALTHPASWSEFKIDLLRHAAALAGVDDVSLITEPEAAALHYASQERVEPGATIAVYDLGGGTFDAAVLRRTGDGFELLGVPEGMERFGGIDIDRALIQHVDDALGGTLGEQAAARDPSTAAASARLRDDVRTAKEALSADSDATIPIMLPGLATEVRITRDELESMVRPRLHETVDALRRCIGSAGLDWPEITAVLAVGGTSRVPLVRDVVRERSGRPVVVDTHPKHAVALGASGWAWSRRPEPSASMPPVDITSLPAQGLPTQVIAHPVGAPRNDRGGRRTALIAGAAVGALLLGGGLVLALAGGDDEGTAVAPSTIEGPVGTTASATTVPATAPSTDAATTAPPSTIATTTEPVAPTTPAVTTPATTVPGLGDEVIEIIDDTGSFAVTIPSAAERSTEPIDLAGVGFAHVSASESLASYLAGDWNTFGFTVLATDSANGAPSDLVAAFAPGAACTASSGEIPYTGAAGNGVLVEYDGCGDGTRAQTLIAIDIPAQAAVVLIGVQGPGPAAEGLTQYADLILSTVRAV